MLNQKERKRVENYTNSSGIRKAWYYAVVALTMGNVNEAVKQHESDKGRVVRTSGRDPLEDSKCGYAGRGYIPATSTPSRRLGGYSYNIHDTEPVLVINEQDEKENLDALTAAVLSNQNEFSGGGDFAGGGSR